MFCLVWILNQENGKSVSMHTVDSHIDMAYLRGGFPTFFSFKKSKNLLNDCHLWCLVKKEVKLKDPVLAENLLTVKKSSTFHCLDPKCVRRCNKSSGFYLFTNRTWLYCFRVYFFLLLIIRGGWGAHLNFLTSWIVVGGVGGICRVRGSRCVSATVWM